MRIVSAQAQAALDSGRFVERNGFYADMPDGIAGFWDDSYDIAVGGVDYYGAPGGFTIGTLSSVAGLGARNVDITMSGLNAEIASLILAQPYHQRPVVITRFVMSIDAPQVIHASQWFAGFIDTIARRDKGSGTSTLVARCEDIGRENTRRGARTRSDADQRQIDSDDAFFANVTQSITTEVEWGRMTQTVPSDNRKWWQKLF